MSSIHPLTQRLIERLPSPPPNPILDFAAGSGRNGEALRRAGFSVISISDDVAASPSPLAGIADPLSAALTTHGLLHGTSAAIAARVRAIGDRLEPGGLLYATFGSTRDERFGCGARLDDATYAPVDGDERGVAHTYFDDARNSRALGRALPDRVARRIRRRRHRRFVGTSATPACRRGALVRASAQAVKRALCFAIAILVAGCTHAGARHTAGTSLIFTGLAGEPDSLNPMFSNEADALKF